MPTNEIMVAAGTTAVISVAATLTATSVFKWIVTISKPVLKQMWTRLTKEGKAGFVQFLVLCWACAMLTANYAGWMEKMDPTYIASILSGTLASAFSISREKKS